VDAVPDAPELCVHLKNTNLKWKVGYNNFKQTHIKRKRVTRYEIRENILFVEKIIFIYKVRLKGGGMHPVAL
jgi:hypothetical protein